MTEAARQHGHTEEAAKVMAEWCRQVILFHGKKHPQEMGRMEVNAYLGHVAKMEKDPLRGVAAGDPGLPPGRGYVP
ncbi:MAG: hypothetical protein EXR98_21230 [Gemmataceae bacterium]|nr:hypothetical protein [Gemmataceae bacterium]